MFKINDIVQLEPVGRIEQEFSWRIVVVTHSSSLFFDNCFQGIFLYYHNRFHEADFYYTAPQIRISE